MRGKVFVKVPSGTRLPPLPPGQPKPPVAGFRALEGVASLPVGSVVDARAGTLKLTTAADFKKGTVRRRLQAGTFSAAIFAIKQARSRRAAQAKLPPTDIVLRTPPRKGRACAVSRPPKGAIRRLTATAKGVFRTVAGASTVTIRNATWTTQDRCNGTVTRVVRGRASVFDRNRRRTIRLRQGRSYRAKARLFGAKVKRR